MVWKEQNDSQIHDCLHTILKIQYGYTTTFNNCFLLHSIRYFPLKPSNHINCETRQQNIISHIAAVYPPFEKLPKKLIPQVLSWPLNASPSRKPSKPSALSTPRGIPVSVNLLLVRPFGRHLPLPTTSQSVCVRVYVPLVTICFIAGSMWVRHVA